MDKKHQINLWYVVIAIGLLLFQNLYRTWRSVEPIPYSEFAQYLKDNKITEVQVEEQQLVGKFKAPLQDGRTDFATNRVDPAIADELTKYGVEFDGVTDYTFLSNLLSWIVPIGFFFALWAFFIRRVAEKQGQGGLMTVGKSKTKVYVELIVDHARDGEVMIACAMERPADAAFDRIPAAAGLPGWCATYWIKMLSGIEVLDQPDTNVWMKTAYTILDTPYANMRPGESEAKMVPINRMVPRSFSSSIR